MTNTKGSLVAANLTRDEALERSGLITVGSYQVELDLTGGDATFRSVSKVGFDCARPGAGTFLNLAAPEVHAITLNGTAVSLEAFDGERITLDGLAAHNELVVEAECAYSRSGEGLHRFTDPVGRQRLHVLRPGDVRRAPHLRVLRPAGHEGDLRADRARARGLAGRLQHGARRRRRHPRRGRRAGLALRPDAGHVDVHHPRLGRPLLRGARRARRDPARDHVPPVAGPVPGPGRDLRGHAAGVRLLPRGVRHQVPVRQVRPAVRARVQRRRDGERRRGHARSRTTSSGRGSPTSPGRRAARPSCTRWRTCGSATW